MGTDTVGSRLRKARETRKITRQALAETIGKSATTIQRWEKDQNEPSRSDLTVIGQVLGCSPAWLETGEGNPNDLVIPITTFDPTIEPGIGAKKISITERAMERFGELVKAATAHESLPEIRIRIMAFARELEDTANDAEKRQLRLLVDELLELNKKVDEGE